MHIRIEVVPVRVQAAEVNLRCCTQPASHSHRPWTAAVHGYGTRYVVHQYMVHGMRYAKPWLPGHTKFPKGTAINP